ncbi:MAG: hypothetical protein AVDCRST_MAG19-3528, partial [uncultured Thermomicrobiales bacterium]
CGAATPDYRNSLERLSAASAVEGNPRFSSSEVVGTPTGGGHVSRMRLH